MFALLARLLVRPGSKGELDDRMRQVQEEVRMYGKPLDGAGSQERLAFARMSVEDE